jgi:hypothetical protein
MPFVLGTVAFGLIGVLLAYLAIRPRLRTNRKYDAGTVSADWLQQQRGQSDDHQR